MKLWHLALFFKADTVITCSSVSHFLLQEAYWEVGVKHFWVSGIVVSCGLHFSSLLVMDGNPISMSLLQCSWENYVFSKIHSPSSVVEGIMTLNLFISLNCQQFSVAIDSLTLKCSGTVNIRNVRLALTELRQLYYQRVASLSCAEGVRWFERDFLQLTINSIICLKMENQWNQECSQSRKIIFKSKSLMKLSLDHNKPSQWELWVWNLKFKIINDD